MRYFELKESQIKVAKFNPKIHIWNPSLYDSTENSHASYMITSALKERDSIHLVALNGTAIVGAVAFYVASQAKVIDTVIEWIGSVSPGAGSLLLKAVIDYSRKHRSTAILLWSTEDGDDFYIKNGFAPTGDGEGHMKLELK